MSEYMPKSGSECPICHKKMSTRGNLHTHIKIHSSVKSFQCEICNKRFRRKHHLMTHQIGVHSIFNWKKNPKVLYERPSVLFSMDCSTCYNQLSAFIRSLLCTKRRPRRWPSFLWKLILTVVTVPRTFSSLSCNQSMHIAPDKRSIYINIFLFLHERIIWASTRKNLQ